ncbi:BRO-N domain-containing protein [Citrobacter freundii]
MKSQIAFHETKFTPVKRNNQIWLTAVEIAQALGYKKSDAVTQIYDRNSDEFRDDMTETLNLSASGNYQKTVRIFSLRGAHLIAMFARTPVAKEFRRWVLDILDKEVGEPVKTPAPARPSHRHNAPTFRYIITLTYKDVVTGQEETFRGGANTPGEIIQGTAKRFGIFVSEMITMPVGAYY